ncbi:Nudix hydrolase 15, mitochondrial [Mycena venus]|uniref:Nudix hydrolase 15, mitochondrial n=1 Tax=Mycena venus TaxID=2733690 RepID=A0A8H6XHP3_9AGAR|nr:Nudix hydrolase 15, mitochondrial [Mycena venus]
MSDKSAPKPLNLMEYHRPKRIKLTDARIPPLSAESRRCLKNLAAYRPRKPRFPYPRERSAAVLVALFVGRLGDLYVLLNRRSSTLRSYAGDTSLPGGKVDPEDRTIEDTARREAFEEIGLPHNKLKVPLLCVLSPFLATNQLIVTPVVVLILDNTLRLHLYSHTLSHPSCRRHHPFPSESELVEVPYHTTSDGAYPGPNGKMFPTRAHRFLTGREAGGIKPVFGLTAAIMIKAASIAHAPRLPEFEVSPPGAQSPEARIAWAVYSNPDFRDAYAREGVHVSWNTVARVAGVKDAKEDIRHGQTKSFHRDNNRRRMLRSKL